MAMKRFLAGVTLASALAMSATAQEAAATDPQQQLEELIEVVREQVRDGKSELISQNMGFTAEEAAAFWPVYERLDAERKKLGDERLAIVKDYAASIETLTDEQARELTHRALANDEAWVELTGKYAGELMKVLPPKTVARFFQVDRRINLLLDLEVAGQIPLVW